MPNGELVEREVGQTITRLEVHEAAKGCASHSDVRDGIILALRIGEANSKMLKRIQWMIIALLALSLRWNQEGIPDVVLTFLQKALSATVGGG